MKKRSTLIVTVVIISMIGIAIGVRFVLYNQSPAVIPERITVQTEERLEPPPGGVSADLSAVEIILGDRSRGSHDGDGPNTGFHAPSGLLVEGDTIYVADTYNNLIRRAVGGNVTTYAGKIYGYNLFDQVLSGLYNDKRTEALFARPSGILRQGKDLLVLDSENHVIRRIAENGMVTIWVGTGNPGSRDGERSASEFRAPQGFCMDSEGNIYVADSSNHTIRKVSVSGTVSTVAGKAGDRGYRDGSDALFDTPMGIAWHDGILYVADTGNHRIRAIRDGEVTTIAGADSDIYDEDGNMAGDYLDGLAENALFSDPMGICAGEDGTLYIADTGNGAIRRVKGGVVETVAGALDSEASEAVLVSPRGITYHDGILYVADMFRNIILRVKV